MANAIAQEVSGGVARVFAKGNFLGDGERAKFGFGLIEEWTNQFNARTGRRTAAPFHPGQSFTTAAAQDAEKKKFNLIVGVMRERDGFNFESFRRAREKFVT